MSHTRKVAVDMFLIQLVWAFWFLGVVLIVNVIKSIIGNNVNNYYDSVYIAGNIFMLIIGLICITFLPHFVGNGVTRKDYFKGGLIASIGLSIVLPIIAFIISFLKEKVLGIFIELSFVEPSFNEIEFDGNFIGDLVQTLIMTPYVNPENDFLLSIGIFSFNLFMYYVAGWFISSCYYRYGGIGILSIPIAILFHLLVYTSFRTTLDLPSLPWFSIIHDFSNSITVSSMIVAIVVLISAIKLLTRKVAIKM